MRSRWLVWAIISSVAIPLGHSQSRAVTEDEVRRVHRSALLIDTHNDVTSDTVKGLDIGPRRFKGHTDIPRLREGGVGAVFFAAYVSGDYLKGNRSANRALEMIDTIRHDIVERYPDDFELGLTADDVTAAHRRGKIAALIGIEGGHAIEDSTRLLRNFYELGVRYMTLTHSVHNNWADSSGPREPRHNGLTAFGKEVISEMNRLGMMVDISHVADKTFWDVLEISKAPVFASHSSCRALSNIRRNMTDDMIAALAKKGGVIQINFGCEFLSQASADSSPWSNPKIRRDIEWAFAAEADSERRNRMIARKVAEREAQVERASLADVVAHIDHVVQIAGIDAVGIGTDFDGVSCTPVGLSDVSQFPNLTRRLLEKGYTAAQVRKVYGENLLRVMRGVEQTSREIRVLPEPRTAVQ